MRVPTAEELAAIAAAYLVVTRESAPTSEPSSRWKLAARLEAVGARTAALPVSEGRWKLAGRVDG